MVVFRHKLVATVGIRSECNVFVRLVLFCSCNELFVVVVADDGPRHAVAETKPSVFLDAFPVITTLGVQTLGKLKFASDESDDFACVALANDEVSARIRNRFSVV